MDLFGASYQPDSSEDALKLRDARIHKFLSMAKLAQKAKVSLATVRDTEAGRHRPSLTTCGKLAAALGMSPEFIDECREMMERLLARGRRVATRLTRR